MGELERGAGVVIESAYQAVIQAEGNANLGENSFYLLKMRAACLIQKLADAGQRVDDGLIGGDFAIEYAKRIRDRAALAIDAHLTDHWLQSLAQSLVERGAIIRASDRIQFEVPAADFQAIQQRSQHLQNLRIARRRLAARRSWANHLSVDLIKLTIAALLGTLPPEHRSDAVELIQSAITQFVLNVGSDDSGCGLGAKCKRLPFITLRSSPILPGEHLLGDDVGFFPDSAREKFGRLEDRCTNFLEVVGAENIAHRRFHKIPERSFGRQQVASSPNSLDHLISSLDIQFLNRREPQATRQRHKAPQGPPIIARHFLWRGGCWTTLVVTWARTNCVIVPVNTLPYIPDNSS